MTARYLAPLFLLAIACDSPGSGGRGGVFPTSVNDTVGGDTTTSGGDTTTSGGDTTTTTTTTTDTQDGQDTFVPPFDTNQPPDVVTPSCTELPFAGELELLTPDGSGGWTSPLGSNLGIGGSAPDLAMIRLESSATGTFSLAGQSPTSCSRCLSIAVDQGSGGTTYFATAGTIQVFEASSSFIDFALSDVTFTAIEGSTVVPGGACLHLASVRLSGEGESCEADCAGKVCGDDGCGGECGPGCGGGTTCNASGTECVGGTTGCTTISPTGSLTGVQPGLFGLDVTGLGFGTAESDFLQLEFYAVDTGSFPLGTGANANYSTCNQCIRIFEDDDGVAAQKIYFQSAGTLGVSSGSDVGGDPPSVSATFTNVELVQVTIESGTFVSTPVVGGKCYKISNRTLSTP